MEELKEYAKYIKEQCDKICGFFIDEYGAELEMYNVFVSIYSRINAYSDNNHFACDVEYDVFFHNPNGSDGHKVMKETISNKPDVQNILAEIERKGAEFARILVQEKLNMNIKIHEVTSTYDMRRKA